MLDDSIFRIDNWHTMPPRLLAGAQSGALKGNLGID
ncbi:hypothetical protein Thi970DRAFT_02261 [Thiorhodovibrio frisius]|uniref:Uncharacterized protein n=1 Tax=Thiorhodovibrio frisius TaxID=631362 RepID=H8YZ93_9GAMM|nr:hypothetical protein Thi970DRAFT_02261 [Thiorhodovibrio frisius]WPL24311.1 hypothetical protein Thiofri_04528 [Thiorhodovibrio frisius]